MEQPFTRTCSLYTSIDLCADIRIHEEASNTHMLSATAGDSRWIRSASHAAVHIANLTAQEALRIKCLGSDECWQLEVDLAASRSADASP